MDAITYSFIHDGLIIAVVWVAVRLYERRLGQAFDDRQRQREGQAR
jgi:hypothetical protein